MSYIMRIHRVTCIGLLGALSAGGCFLVDQQSTENLGRVAVSASLSIDTCGPGTVSAGPSLEYEVNLERQGSTLMWNGPSGRFTGTLSGDDRFCIELDRGWHVRDADPWLEDPGCDMSQIERLCGTIVTEEREDGAEEVASLTARHEVFVSSNPGSNCVELVGITQGQYLTLPCQVIYEMTGTPAE
jgi:hypothetical protein